MHTRVFGWQPINVDQDQFITAWVDLALRLAPPVDPDATNVENRRV
jgi:hypothetical protein